MRKPNFDINIFKQRRKNLAQELKGSAIILTANPEFIRNNDVHYAYRQDSNFFYLTGFEEPESILLFRPGQTEETILFVREKNVERETWDGFRYGPQGAEKEFLIDKAYDINEFSRLAPKLLMDIDKLYYRFFYFKEYDELIEKVILDVKQLRRRSGVGNLTVCDSYQLLGEKRLIKSDSEVKDMRIAAEINDYAHREVRKNLKPGINERTLHGVFLKSIMEKGAAREAYNGIFACGNNATTLHYVFNDQICREGEMLLVDAGPEYNFYASDVTRVYPVSGKFSSAQKRVYNKVLKVQKDIISRVKPGISPHELQRETVYQLTEIMLQEKLLKGNIEEAIKNLDYVKYYPHSVSHWLGMDVHDAGLSIINNESRRLEQGMYLTIEPGLYIPETDKDAPAELRGLGIRIEDNLLVTNEGSENLTAAIPKEVEELEN